MTPVGTHLEELKDCQQGISRSATDNTYESDTSGNDHAESGSTVDGCSTGEDWGTGWLWAGDDTGGADGRWVCASWLDSRGCWSNGGLANSDGDGAGKIC